MQLAGRVWRCVSGDRKNGYTHIDASNLTSGTTITYSSTSTGGANDSLPFTDADEAGDIVLKLHRHNDDEGWHFHGRLHMKNGMAFLLIYILFINFNNLFNSIVYAV